MLRKLAPYLREKEEMADLAIEYRDLKPGPGEVSGKTPEELIQKLNDMADEMSEFNQR